MLKKLLSIIFIIGFSVSCIPTQTMELAQSALSAVKNNPVGAGLETAKFAIPAYVASRFLKDQEEKGMIEKSSMLGKAAFAATAGAIGWMGIRSLETVIKNTWDYTKVPLAIIVGGGITLKLAKSLVGHATMADIKKKISTGDINQNKLFNWLRKEDTYSSSKKLLEAIYTSDTKKRKEDLKEHVTVAIENYYKDIKDSPGNRSIEFSRDYALAVTGRIIEKENTELQGYIDQLKKYISYGDRKKTLILDSNVDGDAADHGLQSLALRKGRALELYDIDLDRRLREWPEVKKQVMTQPDVQPVIEKSLRYTGVGAGFRKSLFEHIKCIEPYTDMFFKMKNNIRNLKDYIAIDSPIAWQNDRSHREWLKREADWAEPCYMSNYLILPWMLKAIQYPARSEAFDLIITLKDLQARLNIIEQLISDRLPTPIGSEVDEQSKEKFDSNDGNTQEESDEEEREGKD